MLWRSVYCAVFASLVWLLHSVIGRYPAPLPRSHEPGREIAEALQLWGAALFVSALVTRSVSPRLAQAVPDGTLRQLILLPLYTAVWVVALIIVTASTGGTWRTRG